MLGQTKLVKIIGLVAVIITIISLYILITMQNPGKNIKGDHSNSVAAHIGGDFKLTDRHGAVFDSQALKGKMTLIYFGFTYCPDICPTTLQKMTKVLNDLDKYKIDINAVFVTVDPERDNAVALNEYLKNFHPKIIGLTGNNIEIKAVADKFKIYFAKSGGDNNSFDYMIDHSSFIYLFDKKGKYVKHFSIDSTADEIREYIRVNI